MGKFMDMIRDKARSWLEIRDGNPKAIIIHQADDLQSYFIKNRIWYRGESNELEELYKQIDGKQTTFWASVPTAGMEIKKSHSGLPKLIIFFYLFPLFKCCCIFTFNTIEIIYNNVC